MTSLQFLAIALMSAVMPMMGAEAYLVPGVGVKLPASIGQFQRSQPKAVQEGSAGGGVMVAYLAPAADATFLAAPHAGQNASKTAVQLVEESLLAILALEERGVYQNVQVQVGEEPPGSPWASAAFATREQGKLTLSYIFCRIKGGQVVKILVNTSDTKDKSITPFVSELKKLVDTAK